MRDDRQLRMLIAVADMQKGGEGGEQPCVRSMKGLQELYIGGPSKDGAEATAYLRERIALFPAFFPRLTVLSMDDCELGLDGITALVDGMKQKGGWLSLEALELGGNDLNPEVRKLSNQHNPPEP